MREQVLAFDCNGTVFDNSGISREEMQDYIDQMRLEPYRELFLASSFYDMLPHLDSQEGIERLQKKYRVVTCSNFPLRLLNILSNYADIEWDAIIPLEASRAYKPKKEAYHTVCNILQVEPHNVTVVSAHANGPDVKGAPNAGMNFQLIRNEGYPATIIELAEQLGC